MTCPCTTFVGFLMHLGFTSHWSKWHFVVVKVSAEMCICQNVGGGIRLSNHIDCDLILWEQPIPEVWWKVVGSPAKMLRKWALKLRIATLAALHLWQPGGTSSISSLHVS